jgi:hypothetical protein
MKRRTRLQRKSNPVSPLCRCPFTTLKAGSDGSGLIDAEIRPRRMRLVAHLKPGYHFQRLAPLQIGLTRRGEVCVKLRRRRTSLPNSGLFLSSFTLQATVSSEPDLFWACRGGGGGSFGLATQFTLSIFPLTNVSVFGVSWKLSQSHAAPIFNAWQTWAPNAPTQSSPL